MNPVERTLATCAVTLATFMAPCTAARADLMLSQMVVDLPANAGRADVEALNNGSERLFVVVEPREIVGPGTPEENSRTDADPDKLGLLASPARLVLEPGQRKLLRFASLSPTSRERVYRVTVRPVVGALQSQETALKILIGFDVLVLVRPSQAQPHVSGERTGDKLTLKNDGNVSVELVQGRDCATPQSCQDLPGARLYAGASTTVQVRPGSRVDYKLQLGGKLIPVQF